MWTPGKRHIVCAAHTVFPGDRALLEPTPQENSGTAWRVNTPALKILELAPPGGSKSHFAPVF